MRLKEQHGYLKLILSIGGGAASQNFATVASSAATRDNFGQSAKGLIDASGFDGIDSKIHETLLESLLTPFKLIGSIPLMHSKVQTFLHCLPPSAFTFPTTAIS